MLCFQFLAQSLILGRYSVLRNTMGDIGNRTESINFLLKPDAVNFTI